MFSFFRRSKATLPADFDDGQYLALHPDVAAAGVNPRRHYLRHGHAEGRRYKPQRKVYVDLGANHGVTVENFLRDQPATEVFAFEPAPELAKELREKFSNHTNVHIIEAAAWVADEKITFYPGDQSDKSSTLLTGKSETSPWKIRYDSGFDVQGIDIAKWLLNHTSDDDLVVMKMDVEGSEYRLLPRLMETKALSRLREIRVEWHWDRYPDEVTEARHHEIRDKLKTFVEVVDWH